MVVNHHELEALKKLLNPCCRFYALFTDNEILCGRQNEF